MTKTVQIGIRIPQATADRLDQLRGRETRTEFVRRILINALKPEGSGATDSQHQLGQNTHSSRIRDQDGYINQVQAGLIERAK